MNTTPRSIGYANTITVLAQSIKGMAASVLTIENSPLKKLDPMVAHMMFQMLAFIWSGIFAVILGSYMAFGISAFLHVVFISGVVFTAMIFRQAEQSKPDFDLRPGYHSVTRTRQNLWVNGNQITLDSKDPGGEHE